MYRIVLLTALLLLLGAPTFAAGPNKGQGTGMQIYGAELMSQQEQQQYQYRLETLNSEQEKEKFRNQHQHKMQERAKKLGKNLPDQPRDGKYGHSFGSGSMGKGSKGGKR